MVTEKVTKPEQPYKATINKETLRRWGEIRVWDQPQSAVDGGKVLDSVKAVVEVTVVEEQRGMFDTVQRAKIRYGHGKEGWVLWEAIQKK